MKTKIIKNKGYYKLLVDDPVVNMQSQYGSPIVLACITHFFDSGCWSFDDYRLSEHNIVGAYLDDSNDTIFDFENYSQADKDIVLSKIKIYEIDSGNLFYWLYNTTDLDGDIPLEDERRQLTTGVFLSRRACFTFKAAQKKLSEAKDFWENYNGSIFAPIVKRENKHVQPHSASFYFELECNKERIKQYKLNALK